MTIAVTPSAGKPSNKVCTKKSFLLWVFFGFFEADSHDRVYAD